MSTDLFPNVMFTAIIRRKRLFLMGLFPESHDEVELKHWIKFSTETNVFLWDTIKPKIEMDLLKHSRFVFFKSFSECQDKIFGDMRYFVEYYLSFKNDLLIGHLGGSFS